MPRALLAAFIFLAAFGLNLSTLSPSVHPDDSPETVTAGATLSIQHPPGYPLHSILGRLATLGLPGGGAFRVNLLSALLGALGLLLFAFCCRLIASELARRELGLAYALAPTALLACTYSLWFQSSIAKGGIYALNFALTQGALLALLHARRDPQPKYFRLAALCFGLGMANHWTSQVVLLPGFALMLGEIWWKAGKPKPDFKLAIGALECALLAASGLSLYVFLPIRSLQIPVMSWGEPWTLQGFLWVFNRAQYAGLESGKTLAAFLALLNRVFEDLRLEFHWAGLLLLLGSWAWLFRRRPWLGLSLFAMPLMLTLAVCIKANPPADSLWVIDPYLLPLYSGLALGLAGLMHWMPALAPAALALGFWHWPLANQRDNFLAYDYAANTFLSTPRNALLFCEGDSNTALPFYWRHVLGRRADVACVATVLSDYPWYMKGVRKQNPSLKVPPQPLSPPGNITWMAAQNPSRPALITNSLTKSWVDPKRLLPRGLVNILLPKGPPSVSELRRNRLWRAYALRGVFAPAVAMDPLSVRLVRDNYKETPARLAYALQEQGDNLGARDEFRFLGTLIPHWSAPWVQAGNCAYFAKRLDLAGDDWKRAVDEEPASAEAVANLGLYYFDSKNYDAALMQSRRALELSPGMANAKELMAKASAMLNHARPQSGLSPGQQWAAKGDALAMKSQAKEALKAYDEAMRLGFSTAGVFRNRAVMRSNLKQFPEAAAELRQALALEPKNPELHRYLGIMLIQAGKLSEAKAALQECLKLSPSDAQAADLIRQIDSGAH